MGYKIKTSKRAKTEIFRTVDYLISNWSFEIANNFLDKFEEIKITLSKNPKIYQVSYESKNIRKAILTKHNIIYFTIDDDTKTVVILTVFNVLQNPNKLSL